MCPFLLDEHCFFKLFSIWIEFGKPLFDPAPASVIAFIDRDGIAGGVGRRVVIPGVCPVWLRKIRVMRFYRQRFFNVSTSDTPVKRLIAVP